MPRALRLRHDEEMMLEHGVFVDCATVQRWAIKMVPVLAAVFCRRKHPVGKRWLVNETCIKVAGDVQTSPIPGFRFAQSR